MCVAVLTWNPPDVYKVGIRPTDAVVSHIDVTCNRKPPNSRSPVVERHCQCQMKQTWIFWILLVVYRNGCVCDVVVRKLCHSKLSHVKDVK